MGEPKKINPDTLDPLRPEFRGLSRDLASYSGELLKKGPTAYTGNRIAGMTGDEGMALEALKGTAFGPADPRYDRYVDEVMGGGVANPHLDALIGNVTESVNRNLGGNLNMVDAMFARSGMGGGSGRGTQAIEASRAASGELSANIAQILGADFNRRMGERQAVGMSMPGVANNRAVVQQNALGALALPRNIQQQQMDFDFNEFIRMLQEPMQHAQLASQIMGSAPGLQFMQPQYAPSKFQQTMAALQPLFEAGQNAGQAYITAGMM